MTKKKFTEYLIEAGATADLFNTNNAWGFGGGAGVVYTLGETMVRVGRASYRHLPSVAYITISVPVKGRIFDEEDTSKARDAAVKILEKFKNEN